MNGTFKPVATTVLIPRLPGEPHKTTQRGGGCGSGGSGSCGSSRYSRLSPNLSEVVKELRQVGLEQSLKLQAQRYNALQGEESEDKW